MAQRTFRLDHGYGSGLPAPRARAGPCLGRAALAHATTTAAPRQMRPPQAALGAHRHPYWMALALQQHQKPKRARWRVRRCRHQDVEPALQKRVELS
ncbi:hypothetical protein ACFQZ4_45930 [Catellatospora coxensis]